MRQGLTHSHVYTFKSARFTDVSPLDFLNYSLFTKFLVIKKKVVYLHCLSN